MVRSAVWRVSNHEAASFETPLPRLLRMRGEALTKPNGMPYWKVLKVICLT